MKAARNQLQQVEMYDEKLQVSPPPDLSLCWDTVKSNRMGFGRASVALWLGCTPHTCGVPGLRPLLHVINLSY